MTIQILVHINNKVIPLQAEKDQNLLQLLRSNNINISSPCGGNKTCGKCKVKVISGEAPMTDSELELLSKEEVESGYRLACSINLASDMTIELVEEGQLQVMTEGMNYTIDFDPVIKLKNLNNQQIQEDNDWGYLDIIYKHTNSDDISMQIIQQLAGLMEDENLSLLSYYKKLIAIDNKAINKVYGLAVDIGTTTVAVYLMDLLTGEEVDVESFHNPQKKFGADVISRINHIQKAAGSVKEVQDVIVKGLNQAIDQLALRNKISNSDIYVLTAVGNTIMLHFFLGVNPQSIAKAPYRPVFTNQMEVTADSINLDINPQGIVQILPAVSGYVGSDVVADLLVADFDSEEWNLLIDVGTNGEIVLGNSQRMLACSAAAGPAFEGAKITFGMAGVPGAISQFDISDDKQLLYETIDSKEPLGICGSGLIDIVAEMIDHGLLTNTGAFNEDINRNLLSSLIEYKGMKAFKIVDQEDTASDNHILLTQKDVRELQLAKGAIAAGINILLKEAGIKYEDIKNIYLAGGFGSFINPENACKIGLLPKNLEEKIVKIGNGAGLGARAYLLDKKQREKAENIIDKIEYLELSLRMDFQNEFMMSMEF